MMMDLLETREPSLGRSARVLLRRSCSDSDDEGEMEEVGDVGHPDMGGPGCGGIAVAVGLDDSITPAKGKTGRRRFGTGYLATAQDKAL